MVDVTIITAVYGDKYDHFIDGWIEAVENLENKPKQIIIGTDKHKNIHAKQVIRSTENVKWRSPFFWNACAEQAQTKWIWVCDIDDRLKPEALNNLEKQECDIWQVGYQVQGSSEIYIPPNLINETIYTEPYCYFCCASPIQKSWWEQCHYPEVAYADWAMWRKSARLGARFGYANQALYDYRKDFVNSMSGWADADANNRKEALEY
jgi:hypothetical protein